MVSIITGAVSIITGAVSIITGAVSIITGAVSIIMLTQMFHTCLLSTPSLHLRLHIRDGINDVFHLSVSEHSYW